MIYEPISLKNCMYLQVKKPHNLAFYKTIDSVL